MQALLKTLGFSDEFIDLIDGAPQYEGLETSLPTLPQSFLFDSVDIQDFQVSHEVANELTDKMNVQFK